jgi:hypothetical protein
MIFNYYFLEAVEKLDYNFVPEQQVKTDLLFLYFLHFDVIEDDIKSLTS